MINMPSLILLVGAALFAATAAQEPPSGADISHVLILAQAAPQGENHGNAESKKKENNKNGHEENKSKADNKPLAKQHTNPKQVKREAEKIPKRPVVKNEKPQANPAAVKQQRPDHVQARQANEQRGNTAHKRSERETNTKAPTPPASTQNASPTAEQKTSPPKAPTAGATDNKKAEATKPKPGTPNQAKSFQIEENAKPLQPQKTQKVEQDKVAQPSAKPTGRTVEQPAQNTPKASQQPAAAKTPTTAAAAPPPTKPRSADAFILRKGEKPGQDLNAVRQSRHETRQGNRVVIHEGDRIIERENNRAFIRHSESNRFAVGARSVDVEHHGNRTVTIVVRPDGSRIVSTTDQYGHLIRRVRRDRDGREIVIVDDSRFAPPRRDEMFVNVPPPRIRDRDRYIIDADHSDRSRIYQVFTAPPITELHRHYTIDQVRYSYSLREYMPQVDLDIHFDPGSWQLTHDQIDRLAAIAAALNQAIDQNPREVYLIEGYTDAVGSREDNLSLSDRRAEAVAVALTEQFHVPPENLVTQGYGEAHLKVQTEGSSRINRRVAVRRITPLIAQSEIQGQR